MDDLNFDILDDVIIAGFKGNITDINETIEIVNKIQDNCCDGTIIQLMDAKAIAGIKHVKHGIVHAFNSFQRGTNIAEDLGIEICLRTAATRQISKTLNIIGLKKGKMDICAVLISCPDYFLDELSTIFSRDNSVLKEDESILKEIYHISNKQLSIFSISNILIGKTSALILEI
ncbi:MAG: KEOPS complex subunit Cgi121 [Methanobrevibacter sp.]|jgi:KEOPS complex subunit Cgi121|nr:KEOPS complex subunit Cgi121 [Methanobrevibacter sp.]